ncbi:hypothetical protein [Streptomyces sp. NPDC055886]
MNEDEDSGDVPEQSAASTAGDIPNALISMNIEGAHGFFTDDGRARLSFEDEAGKFAFHVDGRLDPRGRGRISILTISPKRGTDPTDEQDITLQTLKGVPINRIRHQLEYALGSPWSDRVANAAWVAGDERLPSPGRRPSPEHFQNIAWVWMHAERHGKPPRAAIAKRWGVTEDTATRWARRCRELGWLDDYDHGQASAPEDETPEADFEETRRLIETRIFLNKLFDLAAESTGTVQQAAAALAAMLSDEEDHPGPDSER